MPGIPEDSEDELDWEEVVVPEQQPLEITIQTGARPKGDAAVNKKKGISHAERLIRIDCHKIHTVTLLANAWVRNQWVNDPLLQARLLSLTPLNLQNAFAVIHKSRVPEQHQRGRMFEAAITNLTEWWSTDFFEVTFDGHIRNRTYDEVQAKLVAGGFLSQDKDAAIDLEALQDAFDDDGEIIHSPKSLMKHALMQSGSRDTSAQLFTALCRGLGIPTRLVVSLQSVPWQAGVGKPKPTYNKVNRRAKANGEGKGKGKEEVQEPEDGAGEDQSDEDDLEEVDIPGSDPVSGSDVKGKKKEKFFTGVGQRLDGKSIRKSEKAKGKEKATPVIKLRKAKSKGNVLGHSLDPSSASSSRLARPDPVTTPPVFWTEVFSRPDARWLPVDPIRSIVNKRKVFDPSPTTYIAPAAQPGSTIFPHPYASATPPKRNARSSTKEENRMVYVLAFEEDGYARDVTRRYAKEFSAKTAKIQGGSRTGTKRQAWWEQVVGVVSRPYRLHRDDVEDEELEVAQMMEGMPTTIGGFKDHPIYVLTRHLKQTEVIHPAPPETKEIGKFRGEAVYPRSSVVSLKTAENWMRSEGRAVKEGLQPLKFNKVRAGTVNRMRELEILKDGLREAGESSRPTPGESEVMQGLYARGQTELYVPDPVVDGKVPKNDFGNIDLYVSSMLPKGAAHVPFKGVAKIARSLGFDYAEAVTGFEFKKRRAFPVIEGVVIAQENEAALLEAYWEAEQDAQEKARVKREERVLKHWTRLVQGLRIRQRLQEQYATKPDEHHSAHIPKAHEDETAGGFLTAADDVVQPFHLPKFQYPHAEPSFLSTPSAPLTEDRHMTMTTTAPTEELEYVLPEKPIYDPSAMDADVDSDMEESPVVIPLASNSVPITMREMAESAARQREEATLASDVEILNTDAKQRPSLPTQTSEGKSMSKVVATRPSRAKSSTSASAASSAKRSGASTPASRRASTRKRKRAIEADEDTEEEAREGTSSPQRRTRVAASSSTPAPSTRSLRPRASKTPAQIQEEKEQEAAFRRATAG